MQNNGCYQQKPVYR